MIRYKMPKPIETEIKALSLPGMILFDKVDKFIEATGQRTTEVRILDIDTVSLL